MVTPRFSGQSRIGSLVNRRAVEWLRDALAALPEPWIVLANRRRSGAEGPPWVRYIALHPGKGIALVDIDPTELAVAPLEDFFEHTGLAALQTGALPVVAVTAPTDGTAAAADLLDAAFAGSCCRLTNPNWCEAVVELLLATPELKLMRLLQAPADSAQPEPEPVLATPSYAPPDSSLEPPPVLSRRVAQADGDTASALQTEEPALLAAGFAASAVRRAAPPRDERWLLGSQAMPQRATWRNWSTSPVTVAVALLALGAVALVSREASRPTHEAAALSAPATIAAAAPAPVPANAAPPAMAVASAQLPPADDAGAPAAPASDVSAPAVAAPAVTAPPNPTAAVRPPKRPVARRQAPAHVVRRPIQPAQPAPHPQRVASAGAPVCADVVHPDLPGGWQYHGPPVPGCLPIRFFGFIGMR